MDLRDQLKAISKLRSKKQSQEVEEKLALLRAGDAVQESSVKKRAQEVRSLLFTFGGFNQTKAIAEQFLSLPEVSLVLSKPKQTKKQVSSCKHSCLPPL